MSLNIKNLSALRNLGVSQKNESVAPILNNAQVFDGSFVYDAVFDWNPISLSQPVTFFLPIRVDGAKLGGIINYKESTTSVGVNLRTESNNTISTNGR